MAGISSNLPPSPKKPKVEPEVSEFVTAMLQQTSRSQILREYQVAPKLDIMQERIQKRIKEMKLMSDTPNYQLLKEEYTRNYGTLTTTLIISGPKGCGKTCALLLLYDELVIADINTLYVDLSKFQSTQSQMSLIAEVDCRKIDTLLIDNVQLYDVYSGAFDAPFVVAASSPGGEVNKKVSNFGKSRGDDEWTQVFFTPFTLHTSKKLLTFYGVAIEDKRITDVVVEDKKISHEDVDDETPYYITPPSPRVTRSMISKSKINPEKKASKEITGTVETSAESADVTVEQGTEEKAAGETIMAIGSDLINSSITTQISTSGDKRSAKSADVTVEQEQGTEEKATGGAAIAFSSELVDSSIATQRSTKVPMIVISKLTWEQFMEVFYYTGGVARYLHRYVHKGNHDEMNSELGQQMQHFVQHYSMQEVCKCVLDIGLTSRVTEISIAFQHGIAYIVDRSRSIGYISSPKCIHMVLKQQDLHITSSNDWQRLELLTLFMLQYINCKVSNSVGQTICLPKPIERLNQDTVGNLPDLGNNPEHLISLAYGHPVIDALMISKLHRCLYFIQTSFSAYTNHKTKKEDLFTKCIGCHTVYNHYTQQFPKYKSIYVYATPEFEHKVSDKEVYFLDLKRVIRWT